MKNSNFYDKFWNIIDYAEKHNSLLYNYKKYIKFCFLFIPKLKHKIPNDFLNSLDLAEKYWYKHEITPEEMSKIRSMIWNFLDNQDATYNPKKMPIIRFIHQLFQTEPQAEIDEYFTWAIELLRLIGISDAEILENLHKVFNENL